MNETDTCFECGEPSDGHSGFCEDCNRPSVATILKERGLSRRDLERLGSFSGRTVRRIMAGERKLSEIERRGIESLPKKRGPKQKDRLA